MINLELAHFLITIISLLCAYMVSTTCVGVFRAWVADHMGDSTARSLGFLSWNPLVHADPLGMGFLFLFNFGWGRHVPINAFNIQHPKRILKMVCAYLSRPLGHLFLAVVSTIGLVVGFGTKILGTAVIMLSGRGVPFSLPRALLARDFSASSSFALSLAFILLVVVYLNVILGVLDLIIDGFYLAVLVKIERSPVYKEYNQYFLVFLPFLLVFFLSDFLRFELAIPFIIYVGQFVAYICGIA